MALSQSNRSSSKPCLACGGNGWWCRGCGGCDKIDGMLAAGISQEEADDIYYQQFTGCDKPFVPCYVCNRSGQRPPPEGVTFRAKFWRIRDIRSAVAARNASAAY